MRASKPKFLLRKRREKPDPQSKRTLSLQKLNVLLKAPQNAAKTFVRL